MVTHKELRKFKIARILKEAYEQNGVLSQADVAEMLGVSIGTVGRDMREYQIESQVMLPYRGTIYDSRAMFLKKMKKIRAYPSNQTHSLNRVK